MKRFLTFIGAMLLGLFLTGCSSPASKNIKFIDYNILNGMWWDQDNNYDRFVAWVEQQDPDVLSLCETGTHWTAERKEMDQETPRYLPEHLAELAQRWGHPYVAVGPHQDNYPVAITSKYPIEIKQQIGEGLTHGALHVKIRGVNYIVIHTWPQKYSKGDKTKSDGGGDKMRCHELQTVLDRTLNNPEYQDEKYWIMTGDMNAKSQLDDAHYQSVGKQFNYDAMNLLLEAFGNDVVHRFTGGAYQATYPSSGNRLDYFYTADNLYERVFHAATLIDEFTEVASDHYPIVMEFKEPEQ